MRNVRNAWYVASWEKDLQPDKPTAVSVLGEPIVLWPANRRLVALEDRCAHRLAPLSLGRCEDARLRCMYHGLLYDADGAVVEIPGQEVIPAHARVRSYPAVVKHSWVWVWMGDPAIADEALIPPAIGFDDPGYILGGGYMDYAAEARFINNNLLDFSHLSYVHATSFSTGPEYGQIRPKVTPLARGVRIERWIENSMGSAGRRREVPMDTWQSYDFLIPGILLMWTGSFSLGTAKACGGGRPDYSKVASVVTVTSQAVTPTGEKTSRYFYSIGPDRNHGDEALRDKVVALADQAFGEDKAMIEAQQRVIDTTPNPKIMPTVHDRGVTLFNLLTEKLVREEGSQRTEVV